MKQSYKEITQNIDLQNSIEIWSNTLSVVNPKIVENNSMTFLCFYMEVMKKILKNETNADTVDLSKNEDIMVNLNLLSMVKNLDRCMLFIGNDEFDYKDRQVETYQIQKSISRKSYEYFGLDLLKKEKHPMLVELAGNMTKKINELLLTYKTLMINPYKLVDFKVEKYADTPENSYIILESKYKIAEV